MQYTMSSWVQITTQPYNWITIFKLSLDYSTEGNSERILYATANINAPFIYVTGTPTINTDVWYPWEGLSVPQMLPTGQWVFLAFGTDSMANMQYGFRYYPQSTTELTAFFNNRTLPCPSYNITPSCTAFWGGDNLYSSPGQILQYVRVYIDYVPTSQDQMINLAMMQLGATLYYFLFTTDYQDVQNSTFPAQYYRETTQGFDTATINSNYPVTFGPYNMIMCRPGAVLSYDTGTNNENGINIAFDIKVNSPATTIQNLFSLRDKSTNYVSLTTYYDPADNLIKVQLQNPNWNLVYTSPSAINLNQWNRVVVELQISNPTSFGSGFYSGRIFVNYSSIPSRTYFGSFSTALLIENPDELTIDICSTMISGTSTRNSSIDGNYDMMNFMWYNGDESLYQNSSDSTCFLSGFLDPKLSACLICNPEYYLDGRDCVSSCSASKFLHSDTSSCQSCYYPSRYYTNTGYCLPCTSTNELISGYSCIICDNSCASCSGPSSTQCTSCYSGFYLLSGNSRCVACNVNCYNISGSQCMQCDRTCQTCDGPLKTNCLTCPSGVYLLTSNNSCVGCNVNGYYISGSQCLKCFFTCLTCNGPLATNCLTCPSGTYFVSSNYSCVACNINGYYISGSQCLQCNTACQTCSGSLATNCLTCSSGAYLLSANHSCVGACSGNGYYISGSDCLLCDSSCLTCNGSLATNCLTCPSEAYLLISNNSCVGACNVNRYSISGSDCYQCDPSCLTCNGSSPTNCLSCPNSSYYLSSNQSCVASSAATVEAAEAFATTAKVIFILVATSAAIMYLFAKGNSPTLMRMLQIMARLTFLKLIDVNYLTPLAKFYDYTDLGQFGLPNVFNKRTNATNTNDHRILAQLNSSNGGSSSNLFVLNVQGDVTFNTYFGYSFSQLFLDNYGGIVFFSCIIFVLYLIVRVVSKCLKDEKSKIREFLIKLAQVFERSFIITILVSRYMYLCSSLIINYAFHPLTGAHEQLNFGFTIIYTILLICIIGLTLCAAFYYKRESNYKLKSARPPLNILRIILKGYNRKWFIGRFFPFWTILSDLMRVLVLLLLYKRCLAQLVVLIIMSLTTIAFSLPRSVFKRNASRILIIGTEVGFIMLCELFFAMYFLENSESLNAYNFQLGLSWIAVMMNISIILFQIIIDIVEFFRLRREKKRKEQEKRERLEQELKAIQSLNLNQLENPNNLVDQIGNFDYPYDSQRIQLPNVDKMNQPESPNKLIDQLGNFDYPYNSQRIQIPDVDKMNQPESPNKLINQIGNFDYPYNSQRIQIPDVDEMENAATTPKKYEAVKVNRNRSTSRLTVNIDSPNNFEHEVVMVNLSRGASGQTVSIVSIDGADDSQKAQLQDSHKR